MFDFTYLVDAPIISVDAFPQLGGNINGPSMIRCPDWIPRPPAKYLLYFAHHEGRSIRLALSDHLRGPWRLHTPPPLHLDDSYFPPAIESARLDPTVRELIAKGEDGNYPHIASPDVWVDHENREIRLYYHGRMDNGMQSSRVALSSDAVNFTAREEILASSYLRLFKQDNWFYALTMPARLYRSRDGLGNFEPGPCLTNEPIRHHALLRHQGQWLLFWTRVGDQPERILVSTIETAADWMHWRLGETREVHQARQAWEGADLPVEASRYGGVMQRVNQLRDPTIFEEDDRVFLLYAIAGEQGIAIGELRKTPA
ncbi:hypothetical protein ACFL3W_01925 [Pseudomonadota bacterium]